jgi:uncharacterized membrane protein YbhN (UPF0104 family)
VKLWLKVAVSGGVLALLFALLPWTQVRDAVTRLPLLVWLGVFAGFLVGHQMGVFKWRLLVNAGHGTLGIREATRCYAAGLFANLCLPTVVGGDVLRAALAGRACGRLEAALLGGVADRVIDIATLTVLIAVGAVFARGALPGWAAEVTTAGLVVALGAALLAAPLLLWMPLRRWPRRLRRPVGRSLVSLRELARHPSAAVGASVLSFGIQSLFVLLNVWIGRTVGINLPLGVWFVAWPLAKVAGLVPISLGGIAVRDATFGALLVPLGVPMATGVVAHLIWQSVNVAGGLTGGLAWWALSRRLEGARSWRSLVAFAPRRKHA